VVAPRRRRRWRWLVAVALVLTVVAAGAAVWRLQPDLVTSLGIGVTTSTSTTSAPPYVRPTTPAWLPSGWSKVVDDGERPSVVPGTATNGGTCDYVATGSVHVVRNQFDVSGCVMTTDVKAIVVADGAVEAEMSVTKGCGGMWLRTGAKGYFVAVCADGTVELHRLSADAPGGDTRMTQIHPALNPKKVVLGLMARGNLLTVYVDGREQGRMTDDTNKNGHVGIGGFAPHPDDRLDATITRFRVWTAGNP